MTYEEIFSRFYSKKPDTNLLNLPKEIAYEQMKEWLNSIASEPYVQSKFNSLNLNDDIEELTFSLNKSIDEDSDKRFVKEIFAQGMVICDMSTKVDSDIHTITAIGGKEERVLLNNYKPNIERLESLEKKFKKFIRDYGYVNNDYIGKL